MTDSAVGGSHTMSDVSTFRLYLLRGAYLLVSVGLAFTIWPQIILHDTKWPLWYGVGCSLLAAVSVLAVLGIRYRSSARAVADHQRSHRANDCNLTLL